MPLVISGYAIVFNKKTSKALQQYGRTFYEVIHPEACTDEFLQQQDVYLTLYHNDERILAHHAPGGGGNLKLKTDEHGVKFSVIYSPVDIFPDLQTAVSLIRNKVLTKCSFVYTSDENNSQAVKYEDGESDIPTRHVYKFDKLLQICIARSNAAYHDTECHVTQTIRKFDI